MRMRLKGKRFKIEIADRQGFFRVEKGAVMNILNGILEREAVDAELSVAFVDDEEIRRLNRAFLGKDTPTDVLAFPLDDNDWANNRSKSSFRVRAKDSLIKRRICGEIVVSVQTALNMAERLNTDAEGEIYLYLIHGLLHLLGYDDKDKKMARQMHKEEEEVLSRFGFMIHVP